MPALCHDEFVPLRTQKLSSSGELGENADLCCGSQVSPTKWVRYLEDPEAVMYGVNSSFPNGYERVDIKILKWIRRALQQPDSTAAATCRRAS